MATNPGKDSRKGVASGRVQVLNPRTDKWVKLDTATGRISAGRCVADGIGSTGYNWLRTVVDCCSAFGTHSRLINLNLSPFNRFTLKTLNSFDSSVPGRYDITTI